VFTGLVTGGRVVDAQDGPDGAVLRVAVPFAGEVAEGDSVAVNGVCLTAAEVAGDTFRADVMHESLRRSALGGLRAGDRVNVELCVRASDRLGGHIVQGHVDGVGVVVGVEEDGFARRVTIAPEDPGLLRYVVEKGSIAVDGVSLTVAALGDGDFEVSLIPETLERTNLGAAFTGARVNLEVDVLAKYVERLVGSRL
jgi:riboflavin synthase